MQRQGSLDIHTYKPVVLEWSQVLLASTYKPMPAIEKLQETWTSSSITTLFHIASSTDHTSRTFPAAGFNWYLQVVDRRKLKKPSSALYFYSRDCPRTWHGTPINVTISFPSHSDDESFRKSSIDAVLGKDVRICCYPSLLEDALVSLEVRVTFTNLLICNLNLFNVLADVVPRAVPDAPLAISDQEHRGPQPSSALRALEQSLKTGTSFDIVFQAYTRRSSLGTVTRPIPIYANTAVLQATTLLPDFAKLEEDLNFSSLFELSEGDTLPFTSLESCGYESDSDLEDDNDNNSSIHNNLAVVRPAEELATTSSDEASASQVLRSQTPESHKGLFIS
ncbi:hypothetical protein CY34DRAFT_293751 [Suillus luteus UH-Slu-Lm8-n1]|uniref:Unplaced genomic scaffold CY34scaffold_19, whole genome shotgun sequence n=1 Tax=Suillus luteus UH-Slu-Lm8-n1 TaxID=930992 RepID=A0A0D0BW32_9AGAM|nr:hypothetical protein CY34DRAFT_293751 [Suillus luteus UH-Slu-Lm8-n1]